MAATKQVETSLPVMYAQIEVVKNMNGQVHTEAMTIRQRAYLAHRMENLRVDTSRVLPDPLKTIADIKRELPAVMVMSKGRVYSGGVSGRRNALATVWARIGGEIIEAVYSWEAVARAVNGQSSLNIGGV